MSDLRIPPLPNLFVLEDRDDGTEWLLSHRESDARVRITDETIPWVLRGSIQRFAAYGGPIIDRSSSRLPLLRLLVRGGRLGYEPITEGEALRDRDQAPIYTRLGVYNYRLALNARLWQNEADTIGYTTP